MMASLLRSLLFLMLVISVLQDAEGWRRRRRRRRTCSAINCQVGAWSSWSSCSHRCGNAGTQYRTRTKTVLERCGGRCPYHFRDIRVCNRNSCQNGGSPANGYCRCRAGFRGTCCEIESSSTRRPYTTYPPSTTTALPCYCYNGGSPVCASGRLRYCICFRGCSGRQCRYCPSTRRPTPQVTTTRRPYTTYPPSTTTAYPPSTITALPCYCYNGGSPVCASGRLRYCICFRGCSGRQCRYCPSTRRPTPQVTTTRRPYTTYPPSTTTALPCYCYNGGSPVCASGRLRYCICFRGCSGRQCRYCPFTTRPFTLTHFMIGFTTRRPVTRPGGLLICYRCFSSSVKNCTSRIRNCRRNDVCYFGQYTLRSNGRRFYVAGCSRPSFCRTTCKRAKREGIVLQCSIKCCTTNLCNDWRKRTPKNPQMLRILLKLLEGFKNMLEAIAAMIKAHLSRDVASIHKREIVSMMDQVDDAAQRVEDSLEPGALQAKRDVAETRLRAQELLKKLDKYTDEDPGDLQNN